jgi:hypothetical protein
MPGVYKMTDLNLDSYTPSLTPLPPKNDKRERKHTAQVLPPGITHNMMKKYVVYYREMLHLKNGKQQPREYFKVESHPKLPKPWVSSKSSKITLLEKLNDANQVVSELENTTDPVQEKTSNQDPLHRIHQKWVKHLPKYTRLRFTRMKKDTSIIVSLLYDRKDTINGFRWTAGYTFMYQPKTLSDDGGGGGGEGDDDDDDETMISIGLHHLRNKIREKYGADLCGL